MKSIQFSSLLVFPFFAAGLFFFTPDASATWGGIGGLTAPLPPLVPVPTSEDTDGDGMPNLWETANHLNPSSPADTDSDFDMDGLTARQEYQLSVATAGQYGYPIGRRSIESLPTIPGYISDPTLTLVACASNGTTLVRAQGQRFWDSGITHQPYVWSPLNQSWTNVIMPAPYTDSYYIIPQDVNSSGQVVGYFNGGTFRGFLWTPSGSGGQSILFKSSFNSTRYPFRISDDGYIVARKSSPTNGSTVAMTENGDDVIVGDSIYYPVYHDVNNFGEFVGTMPNSSTGNRDTFLAIPDGTVFSTGIAVDSFSDLGDFWATSPDIDLSSVSWTPDPDGHGFIATVENRNTGDPVQLRLDGDDLYWAADYGSSSQTWYSFPTVTQTFGAINDWGEFASNFDATAYQTDRLNFDTNYESEPLNANRETGSYFFDGHYHATRQLGVQGVSNSHQVLLGPPYMLWSGSVMVPVGELLPPGSPTTVTAAKLADHGKIILQQGNEIAILKPEQDSDDDGMPDDWEIFYGLDPANPTDAYWDMDGDGIDNRNEFRLRIEPNPSSLPPSGGPFVDIRPGIDSDGDGIPNTWEWKYGFDASDPADALLDSDADGMSNLQEFHSGKNPEIADADMALGPIPRYALFPFTVPTLEGDPGYRPIEINDKGTVLCPKHTWTAGKWTSLVDVIGDNTDCRAFGINDHGEIIGSCIRQLNDLLAEPKKIYPGNMVYWESSTASPSLITSGEDFAMDFFARHAHNNQYQGSRLSNDGTFLAYAERSTGFNTAGGDQNYLWTLPGQGREAGRVGVATFRQLIDKDHYWGMVAGPNGSADPIQQLHAESTTVALPASNYMNRMTLLGDGSAFLGFEGSAPGMILKSGKLHSGGAYAPAIDTSSDGIAIGRATGNITAPIYVNRMWSSIEKVAPNLPAMWKETTTTLLDSTPGGWILGRTGGSSDQTHAVMLPIRVEGKATDTTLAPEATGVDALSIGAKDFGESVDKKIWIMAPSLAGSTHVTLNSPLNDQSHLRLYAQGISFEGADDIFANSQITNFTLESPGTTVASGTEVSMKLELRSSATQPNESVLSISSPLAVKIMKSRTIKVTLYNVTKKTPRIEQLNPTTGINEVVQEFAADNPPDLLPPANGIQTYLNAILLPQINADTVVTYAPNIIELDWDTDHNGSADPGGLATLGPELQAILDQRLGDRPVSDIDVFLLGADKKINDEAWGYANRTSNTCWIVAEPFGDPAKPRSGRDIAEVSQTIAHEIGHILAGNGHPDKDDGPAPLKGTDRKQRLLHSGDGLNREFGDSYIRTARGHRLVKKEWDAAELWLSQRPAGDN
ncbi:MAG: hypothetical protein V4640_04015 [Verrucomicrobiota bacterium]